MLSPLMVLRFSDGSREVGLIGNVGFPCPSHGNLLRKESVEIAGNPQVGLLDIKVESLAGYGLPPLLCKRSILAD
jgi:hypothetical protein